MAESEVKPDQRKIRILRAIVIILGVLIIVVFAVMIAFAVQKFARKTDAVSPAAFDLGLPEGAVIKDYSIEGEHMAVRVQTSAGEQIVIVDMDSGRIIGRVRAVPGH